MGSCVFLIQTIPPLSTSTRAMSLPLLFGTSSLNIYCLPLRGPRHVQNGCLISKPCAYRTTRYGKEGKDERDISLPTRAAEDARSTRGSTTVPSRCTRTPSPLWSISSMNTTTINLFLWDTLLVVHLPPLLGTSLQTATDKLLRCPLAVRSLGTRCLHSGWISTGELTTFFVTAMGLSWRETHTYGLHMSETLSPCYRQDS